MAQRNTGRATRAVARTKIQMAPFPLGVNSLMVESSEISSDTNANDEVPSDDVVGTMIIVYSIQPERARRGHADAKWPKQKMPHPWIHENTEARNFSARIPLPLELHELRRDQEAFWSRAAEAIAPCIEMVIGDCVRENTTHDSYNGLGLLVGGSFFGTVDISDDETEFVGERFVGFGGYVHYHYTFEKLARKFLGVSVCFEFEDGSSLEFVFSEDFHQTRVDRREPRRAEDHKAYMESL